MVEEAGKCSFKVPHYDTHDSEMGGPAEVLKGNGVKTFGGCGFNCLPNAGSRPYFRLCLKPGQK